MTVDTLACVECQHGRLTMWSVSGLWRRLLGHRPSGLRLSVLSGFFTWGQVYTVQAGESPVYLLLHELHP